MNCSQYNFSVLKQKTNKTTLARWRAAYIDKGKDKVRCEKYNLIRILIYLKYIFLYLHFLGTPSLLGN